MRSRFVRIRLERERDNSERAYAASRSLVRYVSAASVFFKRSQVTGAAGALLASSVPGVENSSSSSTSLVAEEGVVKAFFSSAEIEAANMVDLV